MNCIWKDIEGFEGLYQVSNIGKIKSLYTNKETFGSPHSHGYKIVSLTKNKKHSKRYIHRLVADAFIPNPDNKPQVNHIDGDKTNNCVKNLEWSNNSENNKHSYRILGNRKQSKKVKNIKTDKYYNSIAEAYENSIYTKIYGKAYFIQMITGFRKNKTEFQICH